MLQKIKITSTLKKDNVVYFNKYYSVTIKKVKEIKFLTNTFNNLNTQNTTIIVVEE